MTAVEFLENNNLPETLSGGTLKWVMIEFAKLHVEAALKAASEKAETREDVAIFTEGTFNTQIVDRNSILNSYPLENIK
jgi:hypothetical protein